MFRQRAGGRVMRGFGFAPKIRASAGHAMTTSEDTTPVKRLHLVALIACALICAGCISAVQPSGHIGAADDGTIGRAFKSGTSNIQVEGEGVVTRILSDDLYGSRHQRFVVRLTSGQTVLVAHNIDIAPRVGGLRAGDGIRFNGEYVWNEEGGVLHWTHRDPEGRHAAGWLKHNGRTYQ
jgi:hypothetical protein